MYNVTTQDDSNTRFWQTVKQIRNTYKTTTIQTTTTAIPNTSLDLIGACLTKTPCHPAPFIVLSTSSRTNSSRRLCFAISRERNHSAASRKIQPIIGTEASSAQSTALLSCSPRESLWQPSSA